jgi:transposase
MAMRRDGDVQADLIVSWSDIPRSPGHAFYDKLQKLLVDAGFDRFVEEACQAYYAARMGAPSVPPGRYFRMLLIGYFEGIHSERGIVWRCSDSLSLREFLRLTTREKVPDHRSYGEVNSGRRSARMPLLMNNLWSPACLLQLTAPKRCPLFA